MSDESETLARYVARIAVLESDLEDERTARERAEANHRECLAALSQQQVKRAAAEAALESARAEGEALRKLAVEVVAADREISGVKGRRTLRLDLALGRLALALLSPAPSPESAAPLSHEPQKCSDCLDASTCPSAGFEMTCSTGGWLPKQKTLPCGCVTCVCKTEDRCLGCGGREARVCQVSRLAGGPRHVVSGTCAHVEVCKRDPTRDCDVCPDFLDAAPSPPGPAPLSHEEPAPPLLDRCPATKSGKPPRDEISACEFCVGMAECVGLTPTGVAEREKHSRTSPPQGSAPVVSTSAEKDEP